MTWRHGAFLPAVEAIPEPSETASEFGVDLGWGNGSGCMPLTLPLQTGSSGRTAGAVCMDFRSLKAGASCSRRHWLKKACSLRSGSHGHSSAEWWWLASIEAGASRTDHLRVLQPMSRRSSPEASRQTRLTRMTQVFGRGYNLPPRVNTRRLCALRPHGQHVAATLLSVARGESHHRPSTRGDTVKHQSLCRDGTAPESGATC